MNQQRALARDDFATDLRSEHAGYQDFLILLEAERNCLAHGEAEALLAISREKSELVQDLARLGERRVLFLVASHRSANRQGMADWFDSDSGTDRAALRRLWNEMIICADQARDLNEVNGALITTRLAHSQQALDAISGMLSPDRTYGPDGHTQSASLASHLGTA